MLNTLKETKFYILWLASVLGIVAVLPYAESLAGITMTTGLFIAAIMQATILYAFVVYFGLRLSERQGFNIVPERKFFITSIISGIGVGLFIKLLDKFYFSANTSVLIEQLPHITIWKKMLASIYGAVNEEILLRLFAVSLFAWLLQKISKLKKSFCILFSIIFCALLFGLGHLPMLYKIAENPNSWDFARVISLNGIAGVVFGLLYWKYGLVASILSHFIADLVIHVF